MRSGRVLIVLSVLSAACGAHAREPGGHGRRPGFMGWEQLTGFPAELRNTAKSASFECTAVSMHVVESPKRKGSYVVIIARTAAGRPIVAIGAERATRISRGELARLRGTAFGDRLSLRGKTVERDGHAVVLIESLRRTPRQGTGAPRLGTLQDVLLGPLPLPVLLELSRGRRLQARVLGMEGSRLRIRTALAELLVPVGEVRAATRLGCGTTCRAPDGRVDFLTSLPFDIAVNRVFAASAAGVAVSEETDYRLRGEVVSGVRIGHRLALMLRTEDNGDVLVFLASGRVRPGQRVNYLRRQMHVSTRLKRGDEVSVRVKKTVHGLQLGAMTTAILLGEGEAATVPPRARDEEYLALDRATRAAIESMFEELVEEGFIGTFDKIMALKGARQRVAMRRLVYMVDIGYARALDELHRLVQALPAEGVPREAGAAAVRALFTCQTSNGRARAAQILGIIGCREGIGALQEATDLFGDGEFAKAAEEAIKRIRLASPR